MQLNRSFVIHSSVAPALRRRSPRSIRSTSQRALRFQGGNEADAGRNLCHPERPGSNIVIVHNVQTGTSALALARRESPSKKTDKLIFHRYGSQYFLTAILGSRAARGWSSPPPSSRRSSRSLSAPASNGNNVEIASR